MSGRFLFCKRMMNEWLKTNSKVLGQFVFMCQTDKDCYYKVQRSALQKKLICLLRKMAVCSMFCLLPIIKRISYWDLTWQNLSKFPSFTENLKTFCQMAFKLQWFTISQSDLIAVYIHPFCNQTSIKLLGNQFHVSQCKTKREIWGKTNQETI